MLTQDIIYSTDLDAAIQELEEAQEALNAAETPEDYLEAQLWTDPEELKDLTEFRAALRPYAPDWQYGVTLIHEDYFIRYTKDLASDIGEINTNWPYNHIDWDAAAAELKQDYTEHDGYYVR